MGPRDIQMVIDTLDMLWRNSGGDWVVECYGAYRHTRSFLVNSLKIMESAGKAEVQNEQDD